VKLVCFCFVPFIGSPLENWLRNIRDVWRLHYEEIEKFPVIYVYIYILCVIYVTTCTQVCAWHFIILHDHMYISVRAGVHSHIFHYIFYAHVCTCMHIRTCMCMYVYVCMRMFVCLCMYTYICIRQNRFIYFPFINSCVYIDINMCVYIYIYIHVYTRTSTYLSIHPSMYINIYVLDYFHTFSNIRAHIHKNIMNIYMLICTCTHTHKHHECIHAQIYVHTQLDTMNVYVINYCQYFHTLANIRAHTHPNTRNIYMLKYFHTRSQTLEQNTHTCADTHIPMNTHTHAYRHILTYAHTHTHTHTPHTHTLMQEGEPRARRLIELNV